MSTRESSSTTPLAPVAIIGMGCLFPKAQNLTEYWRLLSQGEDAITEIPETHWNPEELFDPDPKRPDFTYAKRGGFLSPVSFDPSEFGIPPTILEATDTAQLLSLVATQMALDDAGYGKEGRDLDRERVSVLMGVTGTLELVIPLGARLGHPYWKKALKDAGIDEEKSQEVVERISEQYVSWQESSFPGLLGNVVAGRIANRMDFGGTNCVVDAACASSLSALHLGLMELATGKSDMVITGGADTLNDIFMYMCFSKTPALSPTGDARPFSEDADGTIIAEGVGVLVLKRLDDAERDGDRIYAVIKGLGSSSDGRSQSIYAPRAAGQQKAIRRAYEQAGVSPADIGLLEAHGTGTKVGDAVEFSALKDVFTSDDFTPNKTALGTVKSQIGHSKAAAGAASLIKAALALHHKSIPPTLKISHPNPKMELKESPFFLNTETRPWLTEKTRRAGVSSFGFGGSNFHAVLEEYKPSRSEVAWDRSVEILALSGATVESVQAQLLEWTQWLRDDKGLDSHERHRRTFESREQFSVEDAYRLVLVLQYNENWADRIEKASQWLAQKPSEQLVSPGFCYNGGNSTETGKVAFLFPGQGSQYPGMGRDLVRTFPQMQDAIQEADGLFASADLSDLMYPVPVFSKEEQKEQRKALSSTDIAQPALGAVNSGAAAVLEQFGLRPEAVAGHSYGELVALWYAGVLSSESLHRLSQERGRLMAGDGSDRGTMLAVSAPLEKVDALLENSDLNVVLANRNSPTQGVLSGSREAIDKAEQLCLEQGLTTRRFPVSAAFHSELVADAQAPFREFLNSIPVQEGKFPVYSNTTGEEYPTEADAVRDRLADQILSPVRFVEEIQSMAAAGVRTFVEVGPKRVLSGLVEAILGKDGYQVLTLDRSRGKKSGLFDLAQLLAESAVYGLPVLLENWENKPVPRTKQRMSVPMVGANYRAPLKNTRPPSPPYRPATKEKPTTDNGISRQTQPLKVPSHISQSAILPTAKPAAIRPIVSTAPSQTSSSVTTQTRTQSTPVSSGENFMSQPSLSNFAPQAMTPAPAQTQAPSSPLVMQAFQVVQQGFQAMQTLQQQTTLSHQRFLESQQETSRALQMMMNSSQQLMAQALQVPFVPAPVSQQPIQTMNAPAPVMTPVAPAPVMTQPQTWSAPVPTPAPVERWTPTTTPAPANGVNGIHGSNGVTKAEIVPQFVAPAPKPKPEIAIPTRLQTTVATTPAPVVETPTTPTLDLAALQVSAEEILLHAVAELTGYPTEMLALDMDMEADLGIDSIKRVEILSTVSERLPEASLVDPEQMGSLRSLGQVLDALCALTVSTPTQVGTLASVPVASTEDSTTVLLEVVAELTGYPTEMLALDMDMEADLGIDSIKRVEILSTVSERLPGVAEVDPETMGRLRTLAEVIAELDSIGGNGTVAPAPVATNSNGNGNNDALKQVLMSVVAELTGYPQEMLDMDMDMEADLGIDSIKRVEILSAATEKVPSLESIDTDELRSLRTLGEIVLAAQTEPNGQKGAAVPFDLASLRQELIAGREDDITRRSLVVQTLPSSRVQNLFLSSGSEVWVVDDGSNLSSELVSQFENKGVQARLVSLHAPGQVDTSKVAGFVFLTPPMLPDTLWSEAEENILLKAFLWAKKVLPALEKQGDKGAFFCTVSRMDGMFGLSGRGGYSALQGGLAGLPKTMHREVPAVSCKALDLYKQWQSTEDAALAIVEECLVRGPLEVGLSPDKRITLDTAETTPVAGEFLLDEGDVILIAGGARGVTATVAETLAKAFRPQLVLLGRSPLPEAEPSWLQGIESEPELKKALFAKGMDGQPIRHPRELNNAFQRLMKHREIQTNLRKLRDAGASVQYHAVDVRNVEAVSNLVKQIRTQLGPIRGLIHAAGVLEDRKIVDKTEEQFNKVFLTKVQGLRCLLEAVEVEPLKMMVLFSSVSGRIGNNGQVDYAMANEVLNKVAQQQRLLRPNCRVLSANWGPWEGGMVTPELKRHFEKQGVTLIPLEAGARAMLRELQSGNEDEVEVVFGGMFHEPTEADTKPTVTSQKPMENGVTKTSIPSKTTMLSFPVSVASFPVLESHRIGGMAVVPFALMLEWLGEAAKKKAPHLHLHGYDGARVLKGIRLGEETIDVQVLVGELEKSGENFELPVEIRSSSSPAIHVSGRAILGHDALPAPDEIPVFSSKLWETAYPMPMEEAYQRILFHGSELHGLQDVAGHSAEGMRFSTATSPETTRWVSAASQTQWHHEPLVLDSAFQAAILWCFANRDMASLPTSFASYRQYAAQAEGSMDVVLEVSSATRHKMTGNLTFWNKDGELFARMDGYECAMNSSLLQKFHP